MARVTVLPSLLDCGPGLTTLGGVRSPTAQVKVVAALPTPSPTVTVTVWGPPDWGPRVPETRPVFGLIARPAGRPTAPKVSGSPSGSLAAMVSPTAFPS